MTVVLPAGYSPRDAIAAAGAAAAAAVGSPYFSPRGRSTAAAGGSLHSASSFFGSVDSPRAALAFTEGTGAPADAAAGAITAPVVAAAPPAPSFVAHDARLALTVTLVRPAKTVRQLVEEALLS